MTKRVEVQFGKWIDAGFALYRANFLTLVLAAALLVALSSLTLLILLPPLTAGFILLVLRLIDGESPPPGPAAIFNGFSCFFDALLFMLLWGIIGVTGAFILGIFPIVGQVASLFFSYALHTLLVFSMFLIAERQMNFWRASLASMAMIQENFWPFLGLTIVASVIGTIGAFLFGFGIILTLPIAFCILAVTYRAVFNASADTPPDLVRLKTTE